MERVLYPLITSLMFSGSYIAGKYTTVDLDPLTTTLWRFIVALLFLTTLLIRYPISSLRLAIKDVPAMVLLGVTGIVGYHYFFFLSLRYTEVANTAIINALSPVMMAVVGGVFVRESLRGRNYLGMGLCFVAVLMLLCDGQPGTFLDWDLNRGDLSMLVAVISWCVYAIIVKRLSATSSSYSLTVYATVFGLFCLLFWIPPQDTVSVLAEARPETIYAVLYMGLFGSGVGYLTYNLSVRTIGPTRTSSFVYSVVPILVAVLAWLLFDQHITAGMIVSAGMILVGLRLMMASNNEAR